MSKESSSARHIDVAPHHEEVNQIKINNNTYTVGEQVDIRGNAYVLASIDDEGEPEFVKRDIYKKGDYTDDDKDILTESTKKLIKPIEDISTSPEIKGYIKETATPENIETPREQKKTILQEKIETILKYKKAAENPENTVAQTALKNAQDFLVHSIKTRLSGVDDWENSIKIQSKKGGDTTKMKEYIEKTRKEFESIGLTFDDARILIEKSTPSEAFDYLLKSPQERDASNIASTREQIQYLDASGIEDVTQKESVLPPSIPIQSIEQDLTRKGIHFKKDGTLTLMSRLRLKMDSKTNNLWNKYQELLTQENKQKMAERPAGKPAEGLHLGMEYHDIYDREVQDEDIEEVKMSPPPIPKEVLVTKQRQDMGRQATTSDRKKFEWSVDHPSQTEHTPEPSQTITEQIDSILRDMSRKGITFKKDRTLTKSSERKIEKDPVAQELWDTYSELRLKEDQQQMAKRPAGKPAEGLHLGMEHHDIYDREVQDEDIEEVKMSPPPIPKEALLTRQDIGRPATADDRKKFEWNINIDKQQRKEPLKLTQKEKQGIEADEALSNIRLRFPEIKINPDGTYPKGFWGRNAKKVEQLIESDIIFEELLDIIKQAYK